MNWYNSNWKKRFKFTSDYTKVLNSNSNLVFDLANAPADFWNNVKSDGSDIRVTQSDGTTEVALQVANFNATAKTGVVFFDSIGISTTANTDFYLYYGNASATGYAVTDTYGAQKVWKSNYGGIWHLDNVNDSSSNGNNGTANGGVTVGGAAGKIGKATQFDGVNDYIALGAKATLKPSLFSLSAWIKTSYTATLQHILNQDNVGGGRIWQFRVSSGKINVIIFNSGGSLGQATSTGVVNDGLWHLVHATWDGTTIKIYIDGVQDGSGALSGTLAQTSTAQADIGVFRDSSAGLREFWNGTLNEIRVVNSALTANWITTEKNNQSSNSTFWEVYDEEVRPIHLTSNAIFFGANF